MGDVERIMERVHRLLAIANDPAASDNEQRIALEQAQRLMDRHAIEEWQLEEDHDAIEIIRRMIHLEANPCNWYMAELATSSHWETDAGRHTDGGGPGTDGTSSAPSAFTEPAPTWTRPNPSGPPWKPAAPPCGAKERAPHLARKPTRPGGTATIADSRKRSPADTRSSDVRWNQTAPARNTSPSATDGRNSPSPRDPASPPTGTDDRTGHARPSDSRRPARSPIGLWKSRKTPAKYHTCVIYLGYRQGIGQPASPQ